MKTQLFIRNILIVFALASVLVFEARTTVLAQTTAARAALTPTIWEYKIVGRARTFSEGKIGFAGNTTPQPIGWRDGQSGKEFVDMDKFVEQLGNQGWELVTITSRSSTPIPGWAGVTDEDLWVFKRPSTGQAGVK